MSKIIKEKVALITGSKEGIGFETAMQLALRKWKIIMADKQDLTESRMKIIRETSNENIVAKELDLASFRSVRKFAESINNEEKELNVLINNAGIFSSKIQKTENDLDFVMQVNHLGPFLLTHLLTDILKISSPSRIIFLSSLGAFFHKMNNGLLPILYEKQGNNSNILTDSIMYYNSKLCNMIVSKEFARNLKTFQVTSNCLHPGMTNSNFLLKKSNLMGFISPVAYSIVKLTTQEVEESAKMATFLATSNTLQNVTGKYFVNYQISREPKILEDTKYCENIWMQSKQLVDLLNEESIE